MYSQAKAAFDEAKSQLDVADETACVKEAGQVHLGPEEGVDPKPE